MSYYQAVWSLCQKIPAGSVTTYGDMAKNLNLKSPRLVGYALHANKNPKVPCHRVVDRNGRIAPNYAFGGSVEQYHRLISEGVEFVDSDHVNLVKHRHLYGRD